MNEVKIQIPDNCELIKDGDTYIVREKKQTPPRSWEEFCAKYPVTNEESYFDRAGNIYRQEEFVPDYGRKYKDWCVSREEAEAFLALMQLRQLRKAWVGDWEVPKSGFYGVIYPYCSNLFTDTNATSRRVLSFPTEEMAKDFLNCFRDLCETAKILL